MKPQQIKILNAPAKASWKETSDWLIVLTVGKAKSLFSSGLDDLPKSVNNHIAGYVKTRKIKAEAKQIIATDLDAERRIIVAIIPKECSTFELLGLMRKSYARFGEHHPNKLFVSVEYAGSRDIDCVDAAVSAINAAHHQGPHYGKKPKASPSPKITIVIDPKSFDACRPALSKAVHTSNATNQARLWSAMAGNDLNVKNYIDLTKKTAEEFGLKWKKWSYDNLKKMGAGAFCAVAQGSDELDASIVCLRYTPSNKSNNTKQLVLVGKGVVYDTGGVNVKPAQYMYGMHGDMGGSAVAMSIICLAASEKWPLEVVSYLSIAENAVSAAAYRPNDVVTSLSGKAIEVIHTDAEGRMMLADTLTLASQNESPDLLLDFATLTGTCVRAISDRYSGGFTNREEMIPEIINAGKTSGERVWPFPIDDDFGECLKSDIADILQCRLSGGSDHIEAAWFLKQFIKGNPPWVHVDLSACESEGEGLAHVPGKYTGFGARFSSQFIKSHFDF